MSTRIAHEIDRASWPAGPWDAEPDYLSWTTAAGLPGLIVRNHMGALCGYAAVAPGHPYYEKGYDDVPVDVHGGLTYADHCQVDGPICHGPAPGEPDNVWWLGFDTAHAFDLVPYMLRFRSDLVPRQYSDTLKEEYRDLAYVRGEVESLAAQLAKLAAPAEKGSESAPGGATGPRGS